MLLNTNSKYLRDAARQENTDLLIKLAMRKMGFSGINSPRPTLRKKIVTGIALACQKSKGISSEETCWKRFFGASEYYLGAKKKMK